MVEVNHRLDPLEKKFAEDWARGTLKKYGLTDKEIDEVIRKKTDMLVEVAQKWKQGMLKVFAPELAKRKLSEAVSV